MDDLSKFVLRSGYERHLYVSSHSKGSDQSLTSNVVWANEGECTRNIDFIQTHCPKQCGYGHNPEFFVRNTRYGDPSKLKSIERNQFRSLSWRQGLNQMRKHLKIKSLRRLWQRFERTNDNIFVITWHLSTTKASKPKEREKLKKEAM